jgi:hypothetical protein
MPDIVPILAEAIWDTKADVKKAARDSFTKATALVSNKYIEYQCSSFRDCSASLWSCSRGYHQGM